MRLPHIIWISLQLSQVLLGLRRADPTPKPFYETDAGKGLIGSAAAIGAAGAVGAGAGAIISAHRAKAPPPSQNITVLPGGTFQNGTQRQ